MINSKQVGSTENQSLTQSEAKTSEPLSLEDHSAYRSIPGSSLYLAFKTRPDLCILAGMFGRNVTQPRPLPKLSARQILQNLKPRVSYSLKRFYGTRNRLTAYVYVSCGVGMEREGRSRRATWLKKSNAVIYAVEAKHATFSRVRIIVISRCHPHNQMISNDLWWIKDQMVWYKCLPKTMWEPFCWQIEVHQSFTRIKNESTWVLLSSTVWLTLAPYPIFKYAVGTCQRMF